MKLFLTLFTSLCLSMAIIHTAEAKRFGSGGFGKTFQSSPFAQKKAVPNQTQQKSATTPSSRRGLLGGMMGGLLAGGLFAYLLGSGAFEGIQFMDILLLAGLFFIIMKLLRPKANAQQRQAWATTPDSPSGTGNYGAQHFEAQSSFSGSTQTPMNLPDDFNAETFISGALQHYREVQNAWNKGDLSVIAEYVSPELYAALARQRQAMMVPPQTEILDLDADIVRADHSSSDAEISILFRGRVKDELERSEDGIFDVWHLQRDLTTENAPWVIVGIEAE